MLFESSCSLQNPLLDNAAIATQRVRERIVTVTNPIIDEFGLHEYLSTRGDVARVHSKLTTGLASLEKGKKNWA